MTDIDKREDMIAWLLRDHGNDLSPLGRDYTDAEIAEALRRTAVQEPTDAQVLAALNAMTGRNPGERLRDYADSSVSNMRAALRAAYEEGKKR